MAMIPHVVTYNTTAGESTVLTVPAGKVFIVTWSSHSLQNVNPRNYGTFSGRLITEGTYTANQLTPSALWAVNGSGYGVAGEIILTGWLKDI